jgi:ferredoxin-nitrite reductase
LRPAGLDCAPISATAITGSDIKAVDTPKTVERVLKTYLAHRASREETFIAFARRHEIDAIKAMVELEAAE